MPTGATSKTKGARTEETINYEISKTVKSHVRESDRSAACRSPCWWMASTRRSRTATPTYASRSREEMAQIEALVRSAIGFDAVRGDPVEVINMRFATPDAEFADGSGAVFLGMAKDDLFRIAEMVVLAIVAILVILLVIRPLMARAFERTEGAGDDEAERLLTDQSSAPGAAHGPGALAQDLALEDAQAGEELEQMIDINRVEGACAPLRSARSARSWTSIRKRRFRSSEAGSTRKPESVNGGNLSRGVTAHT